MYYTLGQRQGLKIGGSRESNGEPWFVAAKDMEKNELIVVQGHEHPLLLSDGSVSYTHLDVYKRQSHACAVQRLNLSSMPLLFLGLILSHSAPAVRHVTAIHQYLLAASHK